MILKRRFLIPIIVWACCTACKGGNRASERVHASSIYIQTVETQDLQGHPLVIPALGKVTVLVFFAPHCASCERLVADLDRFQRRFDERKVFTVGVVMDTDRQTARRMKHREKVAFPWTVGPLTPAMGLSSIRGVPTAFVIDAKGRISLCVDGAPDSFTQIQRRVRLLLEAS